jgi:hypothetical protein
LSWIEPAFLWTAGVGILAAGIGYGDLLLRTKTTAQRIEEVRDESQTDRDELKKSLADLTKMHLEHRRETTDRLARIETKIDHLLGDK